MDYEILKDISEFTYNYRLLEITAGSVFVWNMIADKRRPIIEGKVIDTDFTDDRYSKVIIKTEEKENISLIINTKKIELGLPFGIPGKIPIKRGYGEDYQGRADELEAKFSIGTRVRAKVKEKQGLERHVYELMHVYSQ